jgi:hypothetical protein
MHLLISLTSTQKGEGKPYGTVNPQNCHPVFSSTQLSASLQATAMLPVALHGIITMDIEELQKDILAAYILTQLYNLSVQILTTPSIRVGL